MGCVVVSYRRDTAEESMYSWILRCGGWQKYQLLFGRELRTWAQKVKTENTYRLWPTGESMSVSIEEKRAAFSIDRLLLA